MHGAFYMPRHWEKVPGTKHFEIHEHFTHTVTYVSFISYAFCSVVTLRKNDITDI